MSETENNNFVRNKPIRKSLVHQKIVVDHDMDEVALIKRIDQQYPDDVVLIRKVSPHPPKVLNFRSPRFVRNP